MSEPSIQSLEIAEHLDNADFMPATMACARALEIEATMDDSEGNLAVMQIMEAILTADSEEAVLAAANAGTLSSKEWDRPFWLRGDDITWKISGALYRNPKRWPFYALCRIGDMETGEKHVMTGGGATFCTVLYRFQKLGVFDKPEYADTGYPMFLMKKAAGQGEVVIPTKYMIPKSHGRNASK